MEYPIEILIKIINAVREQPYLYDRTHEFYLLKDMRHAAFEKIANSIDMPVKLLKKRWYILRKRFCKEMREADTRQRPSVWPLYKNMVFLEKYILPRSDNSSEPSANFKEEDSIDLYDCDVDNDSHENSNVLTISEDANSQIAVEDVINYVNSNDLNVSEDASPTSELRTSSSHVDSPPPTKRPKISIDALYDRVEKTVNNIEKSLNYLPPTMSTDEAFVKSIVCLMQDLPLKVKEKFQADMYQKIYQLRTEIREEEFI